MSLYHKTSEWPPWHFTADLLQVNENKK